MLRLRFADAHERAPQVPDLDDANVHIWRNRQGGVVAYGFGTSGSLWMNWPDVASFRFSPWDPYITAFPERTRAVHLVWDIYRRTVLPMALQARGFEALHASAIVLSSGVVSFCAVSETGKSTIAYGLSRKGFPQWSDDAVVFRTDETRATAFPLPFKVRLRPRSQEIFAGNGPLSARFEGNGPGKQVHVAPVAISAICLLTRVEVASFRGPARIRPVAPAAAFPAVLTHAHIFDPFDSARRERMLKAYLDLVASVPVLSIEFVPARENFGGLLDAIAEALLIEVPTPKAALAAFNH